MRTRKKREWIAWLLIFLMAFCQPAVPAVYAEEAGVQNQTAPIVLTLGADLDPDQKDYILRYFGIYEDQVQVLTVTNSDERSQLNGLVSEEIIGTRTFSCALVRPTSSGGIQVKTANTNYVTSNMIAMNLSSSGVYNCEVLIAAPFEVSGTGALTGVMMAYEAASGEALDPEKKQLANEEMIITGEIAETVGQDQATLVVNDIKIHIIRDQITDQQEVNAVVDEVIATTGQAASEAAVMQGQTSSVTLGQVQREKLYAYGYKVSQMGYRYKDMQPTLERITRNVTKSTGIDDPITDTFTTTDEDYALDSDSILLNTDDAVMGDDANINATNSVALGDHPAEPIDIFTGDVVLTESGSVKAQKFIEDTNVVAYQEVNGSYALMDLNGNMLTDAAYTEDFRGYYGHVAAELNDGTETYGLLASDGVTEIPFQYDAIEVCGELWAAGEYFKEGTETDYDSYNGEYYQIVSVDIYYLGDESATPVASLNREQAKEIYQVWTSGEYLLLRDKNDTITVYDENFNLMQGDYERYDEGSMLAKQLSEATGCRVYPFQGNYASIHDYNTDKFGVTDRYGNIIVPVEFDDIVYTKDYLMAGGYFGADIGGQFTYVTAGGTVTGSYSYPADEVYNYGMSAQYKAADGSIILLSGDGVESNLGTVYESVWEVPAAKGLLWSCYREGGYDLIDWHGNVLVSGSDSYSVSANGNYVIAQNGYTSSTLYLVNDAAPVALAESVGGAAELEAEIMEGASMEAYTGEPSIELMGEISGTEFVYGTHFVQASNDGVNYALLMPDGTQLTEPVYQDFEYQYGWICAEQVVNGSALSGLLSMEGAEIIPCLYHELKVLNENWVVGYTLAKDGTEEDHDFWDFYGNYYRIDSATIYHISETELTSVTLTRDQIENVAAEEDYLNIQDRTTGAVTTYDANFTAVAASDSIYNFENLSSRAALARKLSDDTGYQINGHEFPDGYASAYIFSQDQSKYGVVDMNGNIIIPAEFDRIDSYSDTAIHYWSNGYFAVERNDKIGYVTKDGKVTCELKYETEKFENEGMAGYYHNDDGTYTLVSADGVETTGFVNSLRSNGNGLFWQTLDSENKELLLDWHGNVLFEGYVNADITTDGKYMIVQQYNSAPQIYAVDRAGEEETAAGLGAKAGGEPETSADLTEIGEATQSDANEILKNAAELLKADIEANGDEAVELLKQAKSVLDGENQDAAALINSAVALLQAGAADAEPVLTLIATAQEML